MQQHRDGLNSQTDTSNFLIKNFFTTVACHLPSAASLTLQMITVIIMASKEGERECGKTIFLDIVTSRVALWG